MTDEPALKEQAEAPKMKWNMSPTIGKLAESLAKAQGKFDTILKENDNPAYRGSKYADLSSIIAGTVKQLSAEGIAVIQMPHAEFGEGDAKMLTLTTMLAHSSGEWILCDLTMPAMMRERFDAQSVGSAVTYARRYALQSMLGVAAEVDDDGNKAAGIGSKEAAQKVAVGKLREMASKDIQPVELVPYKEGLLALRGNGVAIVKAEMTEAEKENFTAKYDRTMNCWTIPEKDGHMFASLCEKYQVPVKWIEAQV